MTLELYPSRVLAAVLAALHAGAGVIAVLLPISPWARVVLVVFVGAGLYRALWLHAVRRSRDAVVALRLEEDETCAVRCRGSPEWQEGRLVDCWIHPRLTLLVVRCRGRWRSVRIVIAPDAVSAEAFRRLRVRLRLQTAAD